MPKLGDLGGSVNILREMRDQLVERDRQREIEDERWGSFRKTAEKIEYACESRDLESLVSAARELKNRLRRPAVRKELARLESDDEPDGDKPDKIPAKKEKNPTGACKCAVCGKVIDGSREPCLKDALCTDCALKNKVIPKDKQKKKKVVVPPAGGGAEQGGGGGGGGAEQGGQQDVTKEKQEGRTALRRRGYLS